jgi:transcription initiation factor TFIID TATA-box-binding protein
MTEFLNKLYSNDLNNISIANNIDQPNLSPNITYYQNSPFNKSFLDITQSNNLNTFLISNDGELYPMDNGNDDEPHPETPKMNINFNSNDQKLNENINHEDPQKEKEKEKSINTETKTTTNKVNTEAKIEIIPTIQNLVSTAKLNCDLRLREISLQEQNTQYNPKRFSGLILRMHNPLATSLIFSNGKIIVLGAKTEEDSENACRRVGKIIKNLNYPVKLTDFKVQNVVGSCDVRFQIDLYKLDNYIKSSVKSSRVAFEPEIFPGLIYRLIPNKTHNNESNEKSPNIAFLIFNSGKIVITGGKNRNQIYEAFNKVYPLLYYAKIKIPKGKN